MIGVKKETLKHLTCRDPLSTAGLYKFSCFLYIVDDSLRNDPYHHYPDGSMLLLQSCRYLHISIIRCDKPCDKVKKDGFSHTIKTYNADPVRLPQQYTEIFQVLFAPQKIWKHCPVRLLFYQAACKPPEVQVFHLRYLHLLFLTCSKRAILAFCLVVLALAPRLIHFNSLT